MPWGDGIGPWWMRSRGYRTVNSWCCGRAAGLGRGFWPWRAYFNSWYAPSQELVPTEEIGHLGETARQLEADLKGVREWA